MVWRIETGDAGELLSRMEEGSVDTCVTDPPYGLSFMGKGWDHGVPGEPYWREVLRVLKPGGSLLAFGGTKTHHRLMCAIEDAGFELRDCLMWLYGQGFPKSLDISKAIDKAAGAERKVVGPNPNTIGRTVNMTGGRLIGGHKQHDREAVTVLTASATDEAKQWEGWGTALKPAVEPIVLAMKPLDGTFAENALKHGVAGLNIDGARIMGGPSKGGSISGSTALGQGSGWNQHANKTTSIDRSLAKGRWPANVVLDEVTGKLLDEQSGSLQSGGMRGAGEGRRPSGFGDVNHDKGTKQPNAPMYKDRGGASRFFYCAKASRRERTANNTVENPHPTVKPLSLMRWLVRLTSTPTGGVVLDPFCGSGSTGVACIMEGRFFIGIEVEQESAEIARARLRAAWAERNVARGRHRED